MIAGHPMGAHRPAGEIGLLHGSARRGAIGVQASVRPPFTAKVCPVMKLASGEARKVTIAATSLGRPMWPSAT
jgi:hypothetical protein